MTLQKCTAILAPLALALRADMDAPTFKAYHRALSDVPVPLLESAVAAALRVDSPFMPRPGELRAMAEVRRRELLAAFPYERCAACHYIGTVRTGTVGGKPVYGRCSCWATYQKQIEAMGISEKPLAQLPVAYVEAEPEGEVAVDDLPPAITDRVRTLAASKWMK